MPSCSDCCAAVLVLPAALLWIALSLGVILPIVLVILIVSLIFTLAGLLLSCLCVESVGKGLIYVSDLLDKAAWKLYEWTICGQDCGDSEEESSQGSTNRNPVAPPSAQRPAENHTGRTAGNSPVALRPTQRPTVNQISTSANNRPVGSQPGPTNHINDMSEQQPRPARTSSPTSTNVHHAATPPTSPKENVVIDMPPQTTPSAPPVPLATIPPAITVGISQNGFSYEDLVKATNKFSRENFLGEGGMASVHKGTLVGGREVAIKQLKIPDCKWGEREFAAEVSVLSRVNHRHLVQLIGCCITKGKRVLVCEYIRNKTLEFHLHGENQHVLDWPTRLKISLGAAKGLSYLHEDCQPRIVHRDIKAANILIDDSFDAKVADFGLAKFLPEGDTHVYATYILGTHGYIAPEYANTGELREESDTYSFGVVLLELITGKKPVICDTSLTGSQHMESLVDWARPRLAEAFLDNGNYDALVDPRLEKKYDRSEMRRMVACASACVRWSPLYRPPMSQVVLVLGGLASPDTLTQEVQDT